METTHFKKGLPWQRPLLCIWKLGLQVFSLAPRDPPSQCGEEAPSPGRPLLISTTCLYSVYGACASNIYLQSAKGRRWGGGGGQALWTSPPLLTLIAWCNFPTTLLLTFIIFLIFMLYSLSKFSPSPYLCSLFVHSSSSSFLELPAFDLSCNH